MKLETFFEKFDQFADAPSAVAKMRELVLEWAVTGKLTVRNLSLESVDSKYLDEPTSDYLPANWRLLNFGKFCDIQGGNQPPKSQFSDLPKPGYIRMFQIRDLGERPVPVYISKDSTNRFCTEGEILIGRYGASVGKVFWAQDGAYNVALAKFIFPEDALCPAFAFWVLKSNFFQTVIAGASRSAQAGFNKGDLAEIDFPLPPLAEQKRIVAKVDELMALCDRLEAQQQAREEQSNQLARASLARFATAPTPANLKYLFHPSYNISPSDLRKSILTLAVQGKLVNRIVSDGSGSEILEKAFVAEVSLDDVPDVPSHWVWARIGSICTRMDSGWSPACISEPSGKNKWGVLKTTAVQTLQYHEEQNKALPPNLDPRPEHEVSDGDILITRAGPMNRVGILCVARPTRTKLMISDKIVRFHLVAGIDPDFAALSMNAGYSRDFIDGLKSGMAESQVNISQPKLRSVPIPIPPLAEQRRIVAKVSQLMTLVDELETDLTTTRTTAQNLLSALVAELT